MQRGFRAHTVLETVHEENHDAGNAQGALALGPMDLIQVGLAGSRKQESSVSVPQWGRPSPPFQVAPIFLGLLVFRLTTNLYNLEQVPVWLVTHHFAT